MQCIVRSVFSFFFFFVCCQDCMRQQNTLFHDSFVRALCQNHGTHPKMKHGFSSVLTYVHDIWLIASGLQPRAMVLSNLGQCVVQKGFIFYFGFTVLSLDGDPFSPANLNMNLSFSLKSLKSQLYSPEDTKYFYYNAFFCTSFLYFLFILFKFFLFVFQLLFFLLFYYCYFILMNGG